MRLRVMGSTAGRESDQRHYCPSSSFGHEGAVRAQALSFTPESPYTPAAHLVPPSSWSELQPVLLPGPTTYLSPAHPFSSSVSPVRVGAVTSSRSPQPTQPGRGPSLPSLIAHPVPPALTRPTRTASAIGTSFSLSCATTWARPYCLPASRRTP
ncbi:hypothetical protein GALMADRAFT_160387 [Galerina marginata CBS 339.88]|uniref:Uncharacterized protein n=1 Tax=Galerina marginata (strain CBS 339.88) TaxID=685588 RepID=A0A067SFD4_GALM3|nr:hypothetical protein GALMADRAFT_160387 [Galerina marginata CBS 339.88]